MSSLYFDYDVAMQSPVSSQDVATDQRTSHVLWDLLSINTNSPTTESLPSQLRSHSRLQSDVAMQTDMASTTCQQSQLRNSHSSSADDLVSELHARLAPLSDFLTRHLAVLQAWLGCASYRQLVVVLCQHIARVSCSDYSCSSNQAKSSLIDIEIGLSYTSMLKVQQAVVAICQVGIVG